LTPWKITMPVLLDVTYGAKADVCVMLQNEKKDEKEDMIFSSKE